MKIKKVNSGNFVFRKNICHHPPPPPLQKKLSLATVLLANLQIDKCIDGNDHKLELEDMSK